MPILEADFCQTIQQDLADIARDNYGAIQSTPTGLLDAALSDTNTAGFIEPEILDSGDGKGPKQALIEYIQPAILADVNTSRQNVCDPGVERPKLRYMRSITKFASTSNLRFTKDSMRKFCERPSEWRAKVVMAEMDALWRKINQISIAQYLAGVGNFYGNVAGPKEIGLLDGTNSIKNVVDPNGEVEMMQEFEKMGYMGAPIVVGDGYINTYRKLADIGCCNQYGQDIGDTSKFSYYYDRDVDVVAGSAQQILAFKPGTVQFVSWNENQGEFAMEHEHFSETTIVDPRHNVTLDMEMNYDRCDKAWQLLFFLNFDLFLLPLTMYKAGDERLGMNGTYLFEGTRLTAESA